MLVLLLCSALPFFAGAPVFSFGEFSLSVGLRLFVKDFIVRQGDLFADDLYLLDKFDLLIDKPRRCGVAAGDELPKWPAERLQVFLEHPAHVSQSFTVVGICGQVSSLLHIPFDTFRAWPF